VANLLPSPTVKKFENRIIVGEVMAKSLVSFLTHGVYSTCTELIATLVLDATRLLYAVY